MEGHHSHCVKCCQTNCTKFADETSACEMVTCDLCGWRCHRCKQAEHGLTCPEERVACVNRQYGCPHLVRRSKVSSHLPVCPASVVCCSEEWSRWPMPAGDKGIRTPFPQTKMYIDCGQLDVGLAMRDQRMLIDSLHAPRKSRRILRNSLTDKYPASPLTDNRHYGRDKERESSVKSGGDTAHTVSEDEIDALGDPNKSPLGLRESIKSNLFLVTKETTDNMTAALESLSLPCSMSSSMVLDGETKAVQSGEAVEKQSIDNISSGASSLPPCHSQPQALGTKENILPVKERPNNASDRHIQSSEVGNPHQPSLSLNASCLAEESFGSITEISDEKKVISREKSQSVERSVCSSLSYDRVSDVSRRSRSTLLDVGGTQLHRLFDADKSLPEDGDIIAEVICLHTILGVNFSIECLDRHLQKPPTVYTFICAQNFRRDEYTWHFRNVHQDIHQGISSGWLQQRCPLAYLGCTFSFMRLEPGQPGTEIYLSLEQESFGLRMKDTVKPLVNNTSSGVTGSLNVRDAEREGSKDEERFTQNTAHHQTGSVLDLENSSHTVDSNTLSLNDLALVDKNFDDLTLENKVLSNVSGDTDRNSKAERSIKLDRGDNSMTLPQKEVDTQGSEIGSGDRSRRMRVHPTIYTAMSWDSKVLFKYNLEEDDDEQVKERVISLLSLPFELLRYIAKYLDNFNLCNLSLTCCFLRDFCCSLLEERGIVVLDWQRQTSEEGVSWTVASKRWMFSTGFEPIKSWRYVKNVPHIGDHLKVCPFNKDILRHSERFMVMKEADLRELQVKN